MRSALLATAAIVTLVPAIAAQPPPFSRNQPLPPLVNCIGMTAVTRPAPPAAKPSANRPLIVLPVDDGDLRRLGGNVHPMARPEFAIGSLAPETRLEQMILVLRSDAAGQARLEALLEAQQDRRSPQFHHWLSPEEFGAQFGTHPADLAKLSAWLLEQGFEVDSVPEGRQTINFSGTAGQVKAAFHTTLRRYSVAGAARIANDSDPLLPAALAAAVDGVASLHDFRAQPMHVARRVAPLFTTGGYHYLAPADFAAIYGVAPLYRQGLDGSGEAIAIVARSDVQLDDLRQFRVLFKLPPRDPVVVLPGRDPGVGTPDDLGEATLDSEWAGALAPGASVQLVASASTATTDGAFLSAQYIVNKDLAPLLSMSFNLCEAWLGSSGNAFFQHLWQQAAAEGITTLVSAGDSGAAGCDSPTASQAAAGRAVNGLCSPPDSACIGGTQFDDTANPSLYWTIGNGSADSSAGGYIPEIAWNESGAATIAAGYSAAGSALWASGGGQSTVYPRPPWQSSAPGGVQRDVPDLAFTAASHDGYLVQLNGQTDVFSGTSLAAPSFAGVMALVLQDAGARQGNINPALYTIAAGPLAASVFHDVRGGNNSVPGVAGYAAIPGYDLATGLGSVDAEALRGALIDASALPTLQIALSAAVVRLRPGASANVAVGVTLDGMDGLADASSISLSIAGLPRGVGGSFTVAALDPAGLLSSTLTLSAARLACGGSYALQVVASGYGVSQAAPVALTVTPLRTLERQVR